MRFTSLFSTFAAIVAVNAAANTTVVNEITQALERGDFVDAAIDLITLGSCDLADLAVCVGTFADVIVDCAGAAATGGANPADDLKCFAATLKTIGSGAAGFGTCIACAEEGISIAQSVIDDTLN